MRWILAIFFAVLALPAAATVTYEEYQTAVLQGLDKVTGRVERFALPVGGNTRFGTLYVTARACRKTPPEELPEATAFLEIDDVRPGVTSARVFSGWLFASTPARAALEHPVYDVWVVDCQDKAVSAAAALTPIAP